MPELARSALERLKKTKESPEDWFTWLRPSVTGWISERWEEVRGGERTCGK